MTSKECLSGLGSEEFGGQVKAFVIKGEVQPRGVALPLADVLGFGECFMSE